MITFNQFWIYQGYQNLPYNSYTVKYVGGFYYFSADNQFYKTYSNAVVINQYLNNGAVYRQIAYDSVSSKFYVTSYGFFRIDVIDSSCSLLQSISIGNRPYGIAIYNGIIYAGIASSNQVAVIQNGWVSNYFTISQCSTIQNTMDSITVDSFGYLAFSCTKNNLIVIYDWNGNYMNKSVSTLNTPYISAIDSNGRFVIMAYSSLDIYY